MNTLTKKSNRYFFGLLAGIFSLIALAACSGLTGTPTRVYPTIVLPTVTVTSTAAPVFEQTPAVSAGADWQRVSDAQRGFSLALPPAWAAGDDAVHWKGSDGFAWVETVANDGAGMGAVCQIEANRDKPGRYGSLPEIQDISVAGASACLILPSADQAKDRAGEGLMLLWYPEGQKQEGLLGLHADRNHLAAVANSLQWTSAATTPEASHCNFEVGDVKTNTYEQDGLVVSEVPLAKAAGCSPYQEPDAFNTRAVAGEPAALAQKMIQGDWSAQRLIELNNKLKPYGFTFQGYEADNKHLFQIIQKGQMIKNNLNWIGQLTISADGKDFQLPLVDSYNASTYILRPTGVEPLQNWDLLNFDNIFPILVGNDWYSLAYDNTQIQRPINNPALLTVKKNDAVFQTYSINSSTPAAGPVRGFWAWDGHWVLELSGWIIQDGKSLNEQLGASEMFDWQLIQEQPFYFYRKNAEILTSYAGKDLPAKYDEVIHDPQWTMAILLQLKSHHDGLTFYARRGDVWYYVIVGPK